MMSSGVPAESVCGACTRMQRICCCIRGQALLILQCLSVTRLASESAVRNADTASGACTHRVWSERTRCPDPLRPCLLPSLFFLLSALTLTFSLLPFLSRTTLPETQNAAPQTPLWSTR
eukprot:3241727-Rhodomonas_salina.1